MIVESRIKLSFQTESMHVKSGRKGVEYHVTRTAKVYSSEMIVRLNKV